MKSFITLLWTLIFATGFYVGYSNANIVTFQPTGLDLASAQSANAAWTFNSGIILPLDDTISVSGAAGDKIEWDTGIAGSPLLIHSSQGIQLSFDSNGNSTGDAFVIGANTTSGIAGTNDEYFRVQDSNQRVSVRDATPSYSLTVTGTFGVGSSAELDGNRFLVGSDGLVYAQRATTTTIVAITPAAAGGQIYNTTDNVLCISTGTGTGAFVRVHDNTTACE